ncbi:MAG: DUF4357 domain-containing protein [Burkholderiales bacterium]
MSRFQGDRHMQKPGKARSFARDVETPTIPKAYRALPAPNQMLMFSRDVPFNSPSAAACAVYGASISGPANWRVEGSEQTYADLRKDTLAAAEAAGEPNSEAEKTSQSQ